MAKEKEYTIIVNGTEYEVHKADVSYEQVVELAFPGHPTDQNILYSVTFEHADQKPHHGTLAAGGQVVVKKHGTIFDVTQTNRS